MTSLTSRPGAQQTGHARRPPRERTDWLDHLPRQWREMAIAPLDFVDHREYEIAAFFISNSFTI